MQAQISFDYYKPHFVIDKPIRLIELFAGIGAQAKALENLGVKFEHYRICEFDKYAIKSYNAIHGTEFVQSDITKIKASDLDIVDTNQYCYILTYSFPCQDLSIAGKQAGMKKGSKTRSGLLWEVERLLNECTELPQVLLMENVTQVHSEKNSADFSKWIESLENLGYSNYYADLNAKNYGVPQNRNRTFMISILGNYYYEFSPPFKLEKRLKDILESDVEEKYYLSSKKTAKISQWKAYEKPFEHVQGKNSIIPTLTARGAGEEHSGMIIISENLEETTNLQATINALTTKCGASARRSYAKIIENQLKMRRLTPKECFRLMTFDDTDFEKCKAAGISDSQLYKQAGNSIVVDVLVKIFAQLFEKNES